MTIKIELTDDEVRCAIADWINTNHHERVGELISSEEVKLHVKNGYVDRPGDTGLPTFDKAVITVAKKT